MVQQAAPHGRILPEADLSPVVLAAEYFGDVGVVPLLQGLIGMAAPLDYANETGRRGAPWWLWALGGLCTMGVGSHVVVRFTARGHVPSKTGSAVCAIANLELGLDRYNADVGGYPARAEGLDALLERPAGAIVWRGPYILGRFLLDPWARPYVYTPPTESSLPQVLSTGPDGVPGTADDITNE